MFSLMAGHWQSRSSHLLYSLGIGEKRAKLWCKGPSLCWFKGKYSASVDEKKGSAFPGDVHVSGKGVVPYILFAETEWPSDSLTSHSSSFQDEQLNMLY